MANPAPGIPPSHALRPGQARAVVALAGLVLLVHALLLSLLPRVPADRAGLVPERAAPMQVRQLATARRGALPETLPQAPATPAAAPKPPPPAEPPPAGAVPAAPLTDPVPLDATPPDPASQPTAPTTPAAAGGADEAVQLPVYATQAPPSATLHFALHRGAASGRARLQWRLEQDGYLLTLQGMAPGSPGIERSSQGGLDAAGIAPLRFAEGRRGRELRAANFQREVQRITFSGPTVAYALVPGSQDRLSWALQLAAVLAANPALATAGAQVSMFVAGTRGDAHVWTFTVQGSETLHLPEGTVNAALHLLREPQGPYDTRAEAWLDPARHHLPVRLRMQVPALGGGTDLQLESMTLP